ncbi:DUF6538 domain-containing protein [Pseudaquabacterium rugosum]|uniref:DUF6538 domain-containing protein n=1 Tax=Pseudaquabacterium rugosum TaxID=2984194 RepID=A0ABU9B3Y9_9BURK
MVFKKTPSHLWANRTGLWHFKLGIPVALRQHFPAEEAGKSRSHVVVSLGTHNRAEALRLKVPHEAKWRAEFRRLEGRAQLPTPRPAQALVSQVRAALAEVQAEQERAAAATDEEADNLQSVAMALHDQAEDVLARVQREEGGRAAALALRKLKAPAVPTLLEGLEALQRDASVTEQYRQAYALAVRELLSFLEAPDALPQEVTDRKTYSGGAGIKKLQGIVAGLRYPEAVERALLLAVSSEEDPREGA